jgi:hypothetical protein
LSIKVVIVDLESIHTPEFPSGNESVIETLANSIVNLRGLLHLPVLYSLGIEEYELLAGHTEFYAYLKAREFDDSLPDRITVLVVNKKNELDIQKQLQTVLQVSKSAVKPSSTITSSTSETIDFSNLEAKLERFFSSQHKSIEALQDTLLTKLEQSLPQPLPILMAFDQVTEPAIALQISKNLAFLGDAKVKKILNLLQAAKKSGKDLNSIANVQAALTETRNGKQTKVIGDKKMLEILDRWHQ